MWTGNGRWCLWFIFRFFVFLFLSRFIFTRIYVAFFAARTHTDTHRHTRTAGGLKKRRKCASTTCDSQKPTVAIPTGPRQSQYNTHTYIYIYGRHEGPEPEQAGRLAVSCQPARAPSKAKLGSAIETRSKCCRTRRQSSNQIAKMCV